MRDQIGCSYPSTAGISSVSAWTLRALTLLLMAVLASTELLTCCIEQTGLTTQARHSVNTVQSTPWTKESTGLVTQTKSRVLIPNIPARSELSDDYTPAHFPSKLRNLFRPYRFKVLKSGRGAAKSWSIAAALLILARQAKHRILCTRELQNSIAESVHQILRDQIDRLGFTGLFYVTERRIVSLETGTEFIFKGLRSNSNEIKSLEGVTICWVEEAQAVSATSWDMLIPTIRREEVDFGNYTGPSEIWISYNPDEENDETHQRFGIKKNLPDNACLMEVSWRDNPWFPEVLNKERLHLLKKDAISYDNVWEGQPKKLAESVIFRGRVKCWAFPTPDDPPPVFYHGADFGSGGGDPHTLMRMYITGDFPDEELWIDRELYGQIELDDLARWYKHGDPNQPTATQKGIDTVRRGAVVRCDNARPDTIRMLQRAGINAVACEKGPGSIEDGINHLKAFAVIHIHSINCPHQVQEAAQYRWKVDPRTKKVILPAIPVDANNHTWDADRYALEEVFTERGLNNVWNNWAKARI